MMYTVFAEGSQPTSGNPAGVVLDAGELSDVEMQRIAQEFGAPTTAFVTALRGAPAPAVSLAFFTPAMEVAMCGHATVAALTALVDSGRVDPGAGGTLQLTTKTHSTAVRLAPGEAGRPEIQVELFPARFREATLDRSRIESLLGGVPTDTALPLTVAHAGLWHLFAAFPAIGDLARLKPDWEELTALCRELEVDTLAAFVSTPDGEGCYHMRDLCGAIGNREEPASGTTSGALVAHLVRSGLLAERGLLEVDGRMGIEMGRPSRVRVRREIDAPGAPRLSVVGTARATSKVAV